MGYFRARLTMIMKFRQGSSYSEAYLFSLSFIFSYSPKVTEATRLKLVRSVGLTVI